MEAVTLFDDVFRLKRDLLITSGSRNQPYTSSSPPLHTPRYYFSQHFYGLLLAPVA